MPAGKPKFQAQTILDVMFECLSRIHAGQSPVGRDEIMDWARDQLLKSGVRVEPMGLSHAVLKNPEHATLAGGSLMSEESAAGMALRENERLRKSVQDLAEVVRAQAQVIAKAYEYP